MPPRITRRERGGRVSFGEPSPTLRPALSPSCGLYGLLGSTVQYSERGDRGGKGGASNGERLGVRPRVREAC